MNITKCVNYECKYFKKEKESHCRALAFVVLCECHNDDTDSQNVNEYKRKLTNLYLKRRKRKNAK